MVGSTYINYNRETTTQSSRGVSFSSSYNTVITITPTPTQATSLFYISDPNPPPPRFFRHYSSEFRRCSRCGAMSLIPHEWKKQKCLTCRDPGRGPRPLLPVEEKTSLRPPPPRDVRFFVAKDRAMLSSVKLRSRSDFKQRGREESRARPETSSSRGK